MAEHSKLEAEVELYRLLEREVTDPLATSLIKVIISDLEADLRQVSEPHGQQHRQGDKSK